MENQTELQNGILKRENVDDLEQPVRKKRKKSLAIKVLPPTNEEIIRLRETENIFHSNLFRLQIEEMLKEIKIKSTSFERISSWIDKLLDFLRNIECSISFSKGDRVRIPNVLLPRKRKMKFLDSSFKFLKPKSVGVFGSFSTNCVIKRLVNIDVYVVMPKEIFHKEDYLNERYFTKRNIYLSCLASKLMESTDDDIVGANIQFVAKLIEKPVLKITPAKPKLQKYSVFVHVLPEDDTFKETRLIPSLNNVRYGWYFETSGDGKLNFPTPYYNSIICQDLVCLKNEELRKNIFCENANLKDAFLLLKVWLRQRKLDEGLGSFNGFLLAMFIVYLYKKRKLNHMMSSYQIIRIVWLSLGESDWQNIGISLAEVVSETNSNYLSSFQVYYDVIFVDVTGQVNLASILNLPKYLQLKSESKYAVQCLDNSRMNSFPALFMTPVSLLYEYDHIIYFNKSSTIQKTANQFGDFQTKLDWRQNSHLQFLKIVMKILERSLGRRVSSIAYVIDPALMSWSVTQKMPKYNHIFIGLRINPEYAFSVIDKGPVANLPEADEFREFWGSKSELRRFKDGSTCETVCWTKSNDCMQKKRLIIRDIVEYILENKFQIDKEQYVYIADQMESVVFDNSNAVFKSKGTGEEAALSIINSFNDLSSTLRQLKDLPLDVTSTQGTSSVFRYSEPLQILPNAQANVKNVLAVSENITFLKPNLSLSNVPLYLSPVTAVIQFSVSNKWPSDLGAIRRLQAAFYIKLSSSLKTCKYVCQAYNDHIEIIKDGYVFRLQISNSHELSAVRRSINSEGIVEYSDNSESLYLEKTLIQLPSLTSAIHGLYQQHLSFGPACILSKRWIRSQLIDDHYIPDICIDLLLSHLFLDPQPYLVSQQPQTMFFRFLKLISSPNWFLEPIIVNFNHELTREDILEIDSSVSKSRNNLPSLVIVTPFDKSGIIWSREEPSLVILKRLSQLAYASLQLIESSIYSTDYQDKMKIIFRPPLRGYDIIIWTKSSANSLKWMDIDADVNSLPAIKDDPVFSQLPIVDFHPIRSYVEELRKHFSERCLFFYNFYGGNFIGVALKPETKIKRELKVSNMKCAIQVKNELGFNIQAMIDDFYILGNDIVEQVEQCTENT